ncbi:MAG: glycosyltransferase, partial [Microcoleaceae cyanobacterium]
QEVMYGGIPPVVFPYGGVKSLIQHEQTGLIVNTKLEYKQAIEYLYHHPEFRQQLGANARQYAIENFGAENAARQLNPIYENLLNTPKRKRLWGLSVDVNLLNQPVRLSDLTGEIETLTGSELFIESLGDKGRSFNISLTNQNLTEILEADANIAKSSPVLCHQYGGGIIHYKNSYPQDSYLRFWSGLVFYEQGKYEQSWQELVTAINLGFSHERINWYLAQVAEKLGDYSSAKMYFNQTLAWQPNLSSLPDFRKMQERLTNHFAGQKPTKKSLTVINQSPLPIISIVTPSLNQGEFLEECIDSILSQNYPRLEYVIMDGGSTDKSVAIIQKYEKYLSYWQSEKDGGQYLAINSGFARTTGEIMAWLNADDKYHPEALFKVAFALQKYPQIEWMMGQPTQWNRAGKLVYIVSNIPAWSRLLLLSKEWLKNDQWIQQESTFWRRSLWLKSGGKLRDDIKLAGDFELWLRFSRFAQLFVILDQLGGFRSYPEQRSKLYFQQYLQEIDQVINEEKFLIYAGQYNTFLNAPHQLNISDYHDQVRSSAVISKNSNNIKVSAIVSTYNSEAFFAGCLEDLV